LPRFIGGSPREVGRKVVRNRYDAFRLEVSPSYRDLFDRDLKSVLTREEWRIGPLKRRTRKRRARDAHLEHKLNTLGPPRLLEERMRTGALISSENRFSFQDIHELAFLFMPVAL